MYFKMVAMTTKYNMRIIQWSQWCHRSQCLQQQRHLYHNLHIQVSLSQGVQSRQGKICPTSVTFVFSFQSVSFHFSPYSFPQFSPFFLLTSANSVQLFNWLPPIQSICSIDFPQFSPFFFWTSILSFLHRSLFCGNVSHFAASLCHSLSLFLYFTHCFLSQFSLFLQIHRKKSQTAVMSHFLNSHWLKIQRLGR